MTSSDKAGPGVVFLFVMGLLTSIGALATDIMLPALGVMGRDLEVADINHTTLVVSVFFFGTAIGQLVVGPLSDAFGRKPGLRPKASDNGPTTSWPIACLLYTSPSPRDS